MYIVQFCSIQSTLLFLGYIDNFIASDMNFLNLTREILIDVVMVRFIDLEFLVICRQCLMKESGWKCFFFLIGCKIRFIS